MKTLAESLFDDNVTNDINVTSIRATEQLIIDGLEDTLKMKCMNIDTAPTSEQNAIWDIGRWTLAMYSADEYLSDTTNIYLQYNIDWSASQVQTPFFLFFSLAVLDRIRFSLRWIDIGGVMPEAPCSYPRRPFRRSRPRMHRKLTAPRILPTRHLRISAKPDPQSRRRS